MHSCKALLQNASDRAGVCPTRKGTAVLHSAMALERLAEACKEARVKLGSLAEGELITPFPMLRPKGLKGLLQCWSNAAAQGAKGATAGETPKGLLGLLLPGEMVMALTDGPAAIKAGRNDWLTGMTNGAAAGRRIVGLRKGVFPLSQ
eukprot:1159130-Pelagomonas_calceolata.AAC.13